MSTPKLFHERTKAGFRVWIVSDAYGGHTFSGALAASFIRALESAIDTLKNVQRRFPRGRRSNRYKAARELVATYMFD